MNALAEYQIRPLTPADQSCLWEMLYQSLYVPEGEQFFDRHILQHPEIARYVKQWGREHDVGFVALDQRGQPIGAIWMRLFTRAERGYGYIDDQTPEIGMAVLPKYRGRGIGTALLSHLILAAEGTYENISLSVAAENPARSLYERQGFTVFEQTESSLILKKRLMVNSTEDKTV
jgi:ribosomal protein S18 acetylase RimI-like enzyme